MDVSQLSSATAPSTLLPSSASSSSVENTDPTAQILSSSFPTALQNAQSSGTSSSGDMAMLQALQKNSATSSNASTEVLAHDAITMMSENGDVSMLQALGNGSNSGVLNLLQSIYTINSQTNASTVAQALDKAAAGTSTTDPSTQDTVLQSILQPQPAPDDSTDPLESLLSSSDGSDGTTNTSAPDTILDSLLQPQSAPADSTDPSLAGLVSPSEGTDTSAGAPASDAILDSLLQPQSSSDTSTDPLLNSLLSNPGSSDAVAG